jgi:hypothetical protein
MSSLRAKWFYTSFVWFCAVSMVLLQGLGWIAAEVCSGGFAAVVVFLTIGATLQGWLSE